MNRMRIPDVILKFKTWKIISPLNYRIVYVCEQTLRFKNTENDLKKPNVKLSCDSGSIPEEDEGRLYNTCAVFGPDGELIIKHRKVTTHQPQWHGTLNELVFKMEEWHPFLLPDSPLWHRRSRENPLPGVWDSQPRQQFVTVRNT